MYIINTRNEAREFVFQFLFRFLFDKEERARLVGGGSGSGNGTLVFKAMEVFSQTIQKKLNDDLAAFALQISNYAIEHFDELLEEIEGSLKNWKLERINKVDTALLLLAFSETRIIQTTPKAVLIDEILNLVKKFGQKESVSFINGILEKIVL